MPLPWMVTGANAECECLKSTTSSVWFSWVDVEAVLLGPVHKVMDPFSLLSVIVLRD